MSRVSPHLTLLTASGVCSQLTFVLYVLAWYGGESLKASITLENQFDLTLRLLLAFGCIFEMPLFSFFLAKLGIVTAKKLRAWRKYAILVNFIIAAIITPPPIALPSLPLLPVARPLPLPQPLPVPLAPLTTSPPQKRQKGQKKLAFSKTLRYTFSIKKTIMSNN